MVEGVNGVDASLLVVCLSPLISSFFFSFLFNDVEVVIGVKARLR